MKIQVKRERERKEEFISMIVTKRKYNISQKLKFQLFMPNELAKSLLNCLDSLLCLNKGIP